MTESAEKNFPAYSHLPYLWEDIPASLLPAYLDYLSNQALGVLFRADLQARWRLACLFTLGTFGRGAVVSETIHLTLVGRVLKNFAAIYATNQTDWNQRGFW